MYNTLVLIKTYILLFVVNSNPIVEKRDSAHHHSGQGSPIKTLYDHTFGHLVEDFPKIVEDFASGNVQNGMQHTKEFLSIHSPTDLFSDFINVVNPIKYIESSNPHEQEGMKTSHKQKDKKY